MIGSGPEKKKNADLPYVDPKDYVFSEETIRALTELALLVRDIQARQAAERRSTSSDINQHHDNNKTDRKTPSA